jgi:hypothetical protein
MSDSREAHLQPGQGCFRNASDTIDFLQTLLKKYPVEKDLWKTKIVGLVIGIKVMQRNHYGASQGASPDRNRERQVDYIGSNAICQARKLSQMPKVASESIIGDINRNDC